MSALSYLCGYGSNSEESGNELESPVCQSSKLPVPNLSKVVVVPSEVHEDNPQLHSGRIRSFPHVRGNWPTFVYIKYCVNTINELISKLEELLLASEESFQRCDDIHISLSRTVVLKYHLISAFSTSLQEVVRDCDSFDLSFDTVKIFTNEYNSRTFVALEVDSITHKFLLAISKKVDGVLTDFQLPTFYENPSFHMSILWLNGDKRAELSNILENLNEILRQNIPKFGKPVLVETISCKIGNKYFQYLLQ